MGGCCSQPPQPRQQRAGMALRRVLVTGGNTGIGLALCKQLVAEDGCHVYLGSRNAEKGAAAVKSILAAAPEAEGKLELIQVDTSSAASIAAAADAVKEMLGPEPLYALVNNAGTGLAHGVTAEVIMKTNLDGPKAMCEAFIPLLDPKEGRIVNVGSGAGPGYVAQCSEDKKKVLISFDTTMEQIDALVGEETAKPGFNARTAYGLSKACLSAYTMVLAKTYPNLKSSCLSPGFIDTAIVKGFGAGKPPEEGTVSMRHCLFAELEGNGYYYGSDAVRSPLHYMRNPGEPAYKGE
mmetsp:Transcript_8608/g.25270  ORF Transcript_8608/g.25270 Transcript_8608/m.25270 type:complete len:294 (+) Transcript_8608:48-929(+)